MKKLIITSIVALLTAVMSIAGVKEWPDEYLGLPGDNLNLYATMKLFQESETLEGFERSLNDESSRINNLDLNGDNFVDYIMVHDYAEGNLHNIVLRVALNKRENQDVAVFTVERFSDGSVQIQLIGDEALYGKNYIVEPIYAEGVNETPNPGYTGTYANSSRVAVVRTTTYEIASWPVVRYIYLPSYVVWRSSWYWGYEPVYWNPWRPYYWHYYYGYHSHWYPHYYSYYRHWGHPRSMMYHDYYYNRVRAYSPTVIININKNKYNNTYSRPDLRSQGEALYSRVNTDRSVRRGNNSGVATSGRRTTSQAVNRSAQTAVSANARRSSAAVSSRTATGQATDVSRRTTNTVNKSAAARSSAVQNSTTARRTATSVSGRTSTSRSNVQGNVTSRRTTTPVTNRNVTAPAVTRKAPAATPSATIGNKSSLTRSPAVSSGRSSTSSSAGISNRTSSAQRSSVSRSSTPSVQRSSSSRGLAGTSPSRR